MNAVLSSTGRDLDLKARRLGLSTAYLASIAIDTATHPNTESIVVARDAQQNELFIRTIKSFIAQMPAESRPRVSYDTKTHIYFYDLNSSIYSLAPCFGVGAGLSPSNVLASEFAYWREDIAKNALEALFEAVPPSGHIWVETTPLGYGNTFAKLFMEAEQTKAQLIAEHVAATKADPTLAQLRAKGFYWNPRTWRWGWKHDAAWARWKMGALGRRKFAQQHDCKFLQSGDSVYPAWALHAGWQFESAIQDAQYGWGADCAEGVGGDASSMAVWRRDGEHVLQVYADHGQWSPREHARRIKHVTDYYGSVAASCVGYIERNNHGHAVILKCEDMGVAGILDDPVDGRPGFDASKQFSVATAMDLFFEAITDGTAHVSYEPLVGEMRTLQHNARGIHVHQDGYHDDNYRASVYGVSALTVPAGVDAYYQEL